MKKLKYFTFALLCVLAVSCNSDKSKIKEATLLFISAVSSKDTAVINKLFPTARTYSVLHLVDSIKIEEIDIEYSKDDSAYLVKPNENQTLVFRVSEGGKPIIVDSYHILKMDSVSYDLAYKTNTPVTTLSDITIGELFGDDGDFIQYLVGAYPNALHGYLSDRQGRYNWDIWESDVTAEIPIVNDGKCNIEGKDYTIKVIFHSGLGEKIGTGTHEGVDIEAGETRVIRMSKGELIDYACQKDLGWTAKFIFKNPSATVMLDKYAPLTGKEYKTFNKWQ